jgi:glycosyltransferase involved in cell wall biosynthesis
VAPYSREWYELWRRADLFVMPTRQEAFGMVYQEAAAAGLPVIATNINAIPEIVQDTVTGLLVRPGDQDQLIGALRTLVKSAELRRQMGTAGRRRITSISDPAAYATKLGDLIRSAVSTQGAPRAAGL